MDSYTLAHRVPIIIPAFNNLEYTEKAVASLIRNTDPNIFECLIVDNGSTDGTPAFLEKLVTDRPENFRAVRLNKNLGFAGGVNKGLELLSSFEWEFGVIANNDLLFTPKWLNQMLTAMHGISIPKLGIVGPMSNFAGGSQGVQVQNPYRSAEDLDQYATMFHNLYKEQWHEAGVVVGLCMLFKREFFNDVGVFDERFFPGTWEENDWELRGALKGWRYAVDRSTFIHHYGSKTIQVVEESKNQRANFVKNRTKFREKWRGPDSLWETLAKERCILRGMDPEQRKLPDGRYRKWVVGACRVKDGAAYMERTLKRVSEFADEIVVLVDHATTDNTEDICRKFPKVVTMSIEPPHNADESIGRNMLLKLAFDRHPDWVYSFDADEVLEERAIAKREELTDPDDPAIMLWVQPVIQLWNQENLRRVDGVWGTFYQGRMFRVLPGQKIDNSNNRLHCGSTPNIPMDRHGFSYLRIVHYGNMDASVRPKKYESYTKIDTDKDLNMALGHWKDYYWRLYYGQPGQQEIQAFNGHWRVEPDPPDWRRPAYGVFFDRDVYRHVKDETAMALVPFSEKLVLSVAMLVKDEAGLLPNAISSVRSFINELIVIDTGSTDGGDSIAEQMGAKVYQFDWQHDFSAARNFALSKVTGDWVLRIDPDEIVPWETAIQLPTLIDNQALEGYVFPITNWLQDPRQTPNAAWALSETCRLYKNMYPAVRYNGLVHEELDDTLKELSEKRIAELVATGVSVAEAKEKGKAQIAKVPFPLYHYGYLRGREFCEKKFQYYFSLGEKQLAANGHDARPYFNTAVHQLWNKQYSDSLTRYQKALELDPKSLLAWNDLAVLYMTVLNDHIQAEKCFMKALECMNDQTHPEHRARVEKNLEELRVRLLSKLLHI